MNEQQPKPKNKKQLTYYLILGACILVIAAVALAVTFSLTLRKDDIQLDNDQTQNDDDDGGDDDATDTSGDNTFGMPVTAANALNEYGFYHNTTLDKYYLHAGIDFAGEVGDEVFAALDGTVESIVTDARLMGTTITLSHANGLKTTYTFVDALEGLETETSLKRAT